MEEYLTAIEAGELLGYKTQSLANLRVNGKGPPFHRIGRKILYKKSTLFAWIDEREFNSTSQYLAA